MTPAPPAEPGGPPRLTVSVTEIRRRLGTRQPVTRTLVSTGFGLTDATVAEGAEIGFEGEAESIENGIVLTGVASVPWSGVCRRCLDDISGVATVDVREIYEHHPVDGETWPLVSDTIDLGPLLHDAALLALPLAPLCGPDCQGPVPEVFDAPLDGGAGAGDDDDPPRDPRWAALDGLDL